MKQIAIYGIEVWGERTKAILFNKWSIIVIVMVLIREITERGLLGR